MSAPKGRPKHPNSGMKKGYKRTRLRAHTAYTKEESVVELIESIMPLREQFEKLAELCRCNNQKMRLDALRIMLAYRIGRPIEVVHNINTTENDTLQKMAIAFSSALLELPNAIN